MAFLLWLEMEDGSPADPPTLNVAVPNMRVGDLIPLGSRSLLVVGKQDDDADSPPVLVVEDDASSPSQEPRARGI
ncbi:MAG TPA: hypothetical protein VKB73_01485 [Gaiellaceae bacterium]|nr:hypothetical protein [Gaiellaceae bacterium]